MKNLLKNFSVRAGSSFAVIRNLFKKKTEAAASPLEEVVRPGWYFDAISWNLKFRPIVSVAGAIIATVGIQLLLTIGLWLLSVEENPVGGSFEVILMIAFFTVLFSTEDSGVGTLVVPPTMFVSELSWFGTPLPIYLRSSEYSWLGRKLGFGFISKVSEPFTDDKGFVKTGQVVFRVWNNADAAKGTKERTFVTAPSKNDAVISTILTLAVEVINPRLCLNSDKPDQLFGDKARQSFRDMVTMFVDTDIPKLHSVLVNLYQGEALVTCFIGQPFPGYKVGSMVRSRTGEPMFELVKPGETAEEAYSRLECRMTKRCDDNVLIAVANKSGELEGKYQYEVVKVTKPITTFLPSIGCLLTEVTFAGIEFSEKVRAAAEQASAEQNEGISQIASAKTQKAARKELLPTEEEVKNPGFELSMMLAAAQDDKSDGVQVLHISGGNQLINAAVAGASQLNRGKKK
jgi:hypothetical protein